MTDPERYEAGLAKRRAVLGDAYVDDAFATATELTQPLQEMLTEYAWGGVWTRPGLTARERSLVNLGMLTALNRPEELRIHVRGALNNGCSAEEIREVLLQTLIYCGAPAAIEGFKVAQSVLDEEE